MATDTSSTGRSSDKFMLRFPDGMRDRIAEAAKASNRSMNAEIVARLERSFAEELPDEQVTAAVLREELRKLQERIGSAIERAGRTP